MCISGMTNKLMRLGFGGEIPQSYFDFEMKKAMFFFVNKQ